MGSSREAATLSLGEDGIEDLYRGQVKREREALARLRPTRTWRKRSKRGSRRANTASFWSLAKGLSFDWPRLYGEAKPRRISLPTYHSQRTILDRAGCKVVAADKRKAGGEL